MTRRLRHLHVKFGVYPNDPTQPFACGVGFIFVIECQYILDISRMKVYLLWPDIIKPSFVQSEEGVLLLQSLKSRSQLCYIFETFTIQPRLLTRLFSKC